MVSRFIQILLIGLLASTYAGTVCGDSWMAPTEKDYFSENRKFVSHVTPSSVRNGCWMYITPPKGDKDAPASDAAADKGNIKPLLEVFEIKDSERVLLWKCEMSNKYAPTEVYTSDDGRYVVTNNEWGSIGYGDCVMAFYNKDGLIKKHSVESILHLPEGIDERKLYDLMPHSVSSRYWDKKSYKFLI